MYGSKTYGDYGGCVYYQLVGRWVVISKGGGGVGIYGTCQAEWSATIEIGAGIYG